MERYNNNGIGRRDEEGRREEDAIRRQEQQQRKQSEQGQPGKKTSQEEKRPMKNEPTQDYDDVGKTEKKGSWW